MTLAEMREWVYYLEEQRTVKRLAQNLPVVYGMRYQLPEAE
jgi:hypothetical protein